ncbi:bifunctional folylpolyglutamate synthase/dihydrofolate synthase [Clostridium cylindrosporum]|uniref:Dihydrofolate synthase/folylpolyglutamate synthase n=1 Tax=Clostridium cylindrosporum DSM 605 TaxID=1121307 RepID=A0A0J8D9G9_CLOCY|nr:folylpolyglutamate synthase/dihydrofolate synthase family protein [Clostridium cylindrosporum]KMT22685.1 folylpolyglutamate synthase [Clostridium cylindrosporum DSM 605]
MNYNEALKYVESIGKFGINLGMKRIERFCEILGSPEKKLKVIHVGGTNGKGSTTTFISKILENAGYRVGVYTSPYIERFTERIRVNKEEIPESEVARLVTEIVPHVETLVKEGLDHPTEFEVITAVAFKYFEEQNVDFVVLEVGLGGRFDATNVVDPVLEVLTTISLDHVNVLGDDIAKIAYEKAGIIKKDKPLVLYPQEASAEKVILDIASEMNAKIYKVEDVAHEIVAENVDGTEYNLSGSIDYKGIKIAMLGHHQVMNTKTAILAIEALRDLGYEISKESIYEGLGEARWPARFEVLTKDPIIVLDGGHNVQGIEALVDSINKYFPGKKIKITCGMLSDKDYNKMIADLLSIGDNFITVTPNNDRALTSEELCDIIKGKGKDAKAAKDINEAVDMALATRSEEEMLVFCGSLYMIGEVRTYLKEKLGL